MRKETTEAVEGKTDGDICDAIVDSSGAKPSAVVLRSRTDAQGGRAETFIEKERKSEGGVSARDLGSAMSTSGIGIACKKGLKPGSANQDSFVACIAEGAFKAFGVFDGHGPQGHNISDYAAEQLFKAFLGNKNRDADPESAMRAAFLRVQRQVVALTDKGKLFANDSGTTGTLAWLPAGGEKAVFGHVGDSRAVLGQQFAGKLTAVELTQDHKPDLKEEKERIEKAGGMVVFDGYFNHRVYGKDGIGGLNMSRAIGDNLVHSLGVTSSPDLKTVDLQVSQADKPGRDLFVLLCSDGVWEFMNNEEVCQIVKDLGREKAQEAAEAIAKKSFDKWMEDSEGEISDDITVLVAWL